MIEVYVQIENSAEKWTEFHNFGEGARFFCQRLSNRMKVEVRAMRGNRLVARFLPHREECSEDST